MKLWMWMLAGALSLALFACGAKEEGDGDAKEDGASAGSELDGAELASVKVKVDGMT